MLTRELQSNVQVLNVFKQTGQTNTEQNNGFSELMKKKQVVDKPESAQVVVSSIRKNEVNNMETKKAETQNVNERQRTTDQSTKTESKTESKKTEKESKAVKTEKKQSNAEDVTDETKEIVKSIEDKLNISEDELNALMALLNIAPAELQQLLETNTELIGQFQELSTLITQIQISSQLNDNQQVDPKLLQLMMDKLSEIKTEIESMDKSDDGTFGEAILKQLETLTKSSDSGQTVADAKVVEPTSDKKTESDFETLRSTLGLNGETNVKRAETTEKNVEVVESDSQESDEASLKIEGVNSKSDTDAKSNDREQKSDDKTQVSVKTNSEGEVVITKTQSESNAILDQITMKQPSTVTNGTYFQTSGQTTVSRQDVFDQIMDSIRGNVKLDDNGSHMLMKLKPESLGSVELKISIHKGVVQAEINVENEMVKAAVESNLDNLKHSLTQKGYQLNQINVSIDSGKKESDQSFQSNGNKNKNQTSKDLTIEERLDVSLEDMIYNNSEEPISTINYYA